MSKLLRRPTRQTCFFCNSEVLPKDPRSFRCSQCGCWNRYDANGEIMSDDPAMHDESLNTRSFARRASPRKDRLPASYGTTVFCHTCQTNQMLISNLLSNYLPPPNDPEYARLSELLPAYRASLETRYPPICSDCLPAVEEEIKRRDQMARTNALGVLLKNSKGKERQRQSSGSQTQLQRAVLEKELLMWRIRGVFWVTSLAFVLSCYTCVLADYAPLRVSFPLRATLPILALLSIVWTAWDPRYATFRRSQLQGREVRLRRKREYNILQTLVWASRLVTTLLVAIPTFKPTWDVFHHTDSTLLPLSVSTRRPQWYFGILLAFELGVLLRSATILRIDRPPPVRLMPQFSFRPSLPPSDPATAPSTRYSTPAVDAAPDLMSTLTLSNNPILANTGRPGGQSPVFGISSFAQMNAQASTNGYANGHVPEEDAMDEDYAMNDMDEFMEEDDDERERDPNAMDWSPIRPARRNNHRAGSMRPNGVRNDDVFLRPQRFFPREEPTGLENLFEKTIKLSDDDIARLEEERKKRSWLGWIKGGSSK